jgi:hypothetical protein
MQILTLSATPTIQLQAENRSLRRRVQDPNATLRSRDAGARHVSVGVGDRLPGIALSDTAGRTVRLDELRGEDTLLVFLRHLA